MTKDELKNTEKYKNALLKLRNFMDEVYRVGDDISCVEKLVTFSFKYDKKHTEVYTLYELMLDCYKIPKSEKGREKWLMEGENE